MATAKSPIRRVGKAGLAGPKVFRWSRLLSGRRPLALLLLALFASALWYAKGDGSRGLSASGPQVQRLEVKVLKSHPHDPEAYTQGLLWFEGYLYESTGLHGRSSLRQIQMATGQVVQRENLDDALFGEGLARVGKRLYQLTWQAQLGLIVNLETFEPEGQFYYQGQGWGLCYDGEFLVKSDGSDVLTFHDPETFAEKGRKKVVLQGRPLYRLNELECYDGEIYANVYGTDNIARIDASSAQVTAMIDASGLLTAAEKHGAEVLNGIAYDRDRGVFLITGKLWPRLFEVTFVEASKSGS